MRNDRKQRRILFLMVLTQLVLTSFIVYWLHAQYLASEERLRKDLSIFYIDTQHELIDSVLFMTYVNPAIRGKKYVMVDMRKDIDTAGIEQDSVIVARRTEDMILRSVRMIVSQSGGPGVTPKRHASDLNFTIDTSDFSRRFHGKMEEAGMAFTFSWTEAGTDSGAVRGEKGFVMDPLPGSRLPEARITGYGGYLLLSLLPQIAFGLFLILLSALAFILAYRSLRDHAVLNNLRNEFIGNITHELKTPVATLSVALEALGRYNLKNEPELLESYLLLASKETARLEELINKVLDHSLLESSSQMASMEETELNALVGEAVDLMRIRLNGGSVTFSPAEEPAAALCDRLYIKSVVLNLIDNSFKYCDKTPEVKAEVRREGKEIVIVVTDNGPGIPAEYHERVFEKFFRLPSGNIHNVKGYGLGLSFASLVMKLHGGTIDFINHKTGCSFTVKLPAL